MGLPKTERQPENSEKEPGHPALFVNLIEKYYPYLLTGRKGHQPTVEVTNDTDLDLSVDTEALLTYARGLSCIKIADNQAKQITIHDRINVINVYFDEDPTIHQSLEYGSQLGFLDQSTITISTNKDYRNIAGRDPYWGDYGLAFFLEENDLYWASEFWEKFDPNKPRDRELALNITFFHEIRHIQHTFQWQLDWYRSTKIAIDKHGIQNLSTDEAYIIIDDVFMKERVHELTETDAESYAIIALRGMIEGEFPQVITLNN